MQDEGRSRERDRWVALAVAFESAPAVACRLAAEGPAALESLATEGPGASFGCLPSPAIRRARSALRRAAGLARAEARRVEAVGARLVTPADAEYPALLRQLALPPASIYVRGRLPDGPAVAIVGSRRASPYGREIATWLAGELARLGVTVVSGFAVGIDAAAHRGALAGRGPTVAVLGCGLDVDYPRGHRGLGREIAERGAVLTEYRLGRAPAPWQFPIRNRLIAALAAATVVVEAAPRSGSLVTARLALEVGRDVLAVPGRIDDPLSSGANRLIADGATPLLGIDDVLAAIGLGGGSVAVPARVEPAGLGPDGLTVWRSLAASPADADGLASATGLPVDRLLALLLELEIGGHVRRDAAGRYAAGGDRAGLPRPETGW